MASSVSAMVSLQGALTILAGQAQRELLLAAVEGAQQELVLDLSAVDAFDSAGVQLLLSTLRSLEERGAGLVLKAPAPVVLEVLETYGLQSLLAPRAAA